MGVQCLLALAGVIGLGSLWLAHRPGVEGEYRIKRVHSGKCGVFWNSWLVQVKRGGFWRTVTYAESLALAKVAAREHAARLSPTTPTKYTYLGLL